jgi:CBS domain-containing protein
MMHILKEILANKQINEIWSVAPNDSVLEAIQVMADKGVGALLVMEGANLKGIISERDYTRKVILKGRSSKGTLVSEIMSSKVITATLNHKVEESLGVMTNHHIRHLPVVEEGLVVGMVSIGDLVKDVVSEQQSTIEQLENYIRG